MKMFSASQASRSVGCLASSKFKEGAPNKCLPFGIDISQKEGQLSGGRG